LGSSEYWEALAKLENSTTNIYRLIIDMGERQRYNLVYEQMFGMGIIASDQKK